MKRIKMVGMKWEGNVKLWTGPMKRVSVFASRTVSPDRFSLESWAAEEGRLRHCIVGTFHSAAEQHLLYVTLANGGMAIWIRGCRLPFQYPQDVCYRAFAENRLLVVSCFKRKHHNVETARYCAQLAAMATDRHAYWFGYESDFLTPICERAMLRGKQVEIYEE